MRETVTVTVLYTHTEGINRRVRAGAFERVPASDDKPDDDGVTRARVVVVAGFRRPDLGTRTRTVGFVGRDEYIHTREGIDWIDIRSSIARGAF